MNNTADWQPPESYVLGQELNWNAPWLEVNLCVELPSWLMVNNGSVEVEVNGHYFLIQVHDNYFQLNIGEFRDSRSSVAYTGPVRKLDELPDIQEFTKQRPEVPIMWRKCKTVLKITSRCNEEVWSATEAKESPAVQLYRSELCRAHIPVLNKLVQQYRLATYDYFAYELSPWDIPIWTIEHEGVAVSCFIVPYRMWDMKPLMFGKPGEKPTLYQLIDVTDLQTQMTTVPSAGEYELLDALNLMERGDYSGAVRRVTTAIEALGEDVVRRAIEGVQGPAAANIFLESTKTRFDRRVQRYQRLTNRMLPNGLQQDLRNTRNLRHRIVHSGYRIGPHEKGRAQRSVDTGRWIFNWFENDTARRTVRESKIAYRGLGRDLTAGIFSPEITAEGVVLSPLTPAGRINPGVAPLPATEKIRRRAYEIYEQRGRQHGHDLDDWLQAEKEIIAAG